LSRALAIALGLIGIDLAHFFKEIFRVRPGNVRRPRPAVITLLRPPRSRIDWLLSALRHVKKLRRNTPKATAGTHNFAGLPEKAADAKIFGVKWFQIALVAFISTASLKLIASAQTSEPSPAKSSDAVQLEALAKKIDEQNAKIDMLSQQILRLQQQIANARPGVLIGEGASPPSAATTPLPDASAHGSADGNSHVVARGETLTSIAKMHGVSISDLQKYNHIDNPLKLQAGQTILIPPSPTPAPSASSSGE
jgi:LysM repeat protein